MTLTMKAALVEVIQSHIEELNNRFISSDDVNEKIADLSKLVKILEDSDTLSEDLVNTLQNSRPATKEGYTGALFLVAQEVIQSTNKLPGNVVTDEGAIDILKDLNVLYITLRAEILRMDNSTISGFGRRLRLSILHNSKLKELKCLALSDLRDLLETGDKIDISSVEEVRKKYSTIIMVGHSHADVFCLDSGQSGVIYDRVYKFVLQRSLVSPERRDIELLDMSSGT